VLNADDEYVSQFGKLFKGRVLTYGTGPTADVRAENIEAHGIGGSTFDIVAAGQRCGVQFPLVGAHNIHNALASVAVAQQCGISLRAAAEALAKLAPPEKRGQVIQLGNITVVNDCYNSNPKALEAMVQALTTMPAKRRIVVAGEMLELGPTAEELHRSSGRYIAGRNIDVLLGVRGLAQAMVESAQAAGIRAQFVATAEEAGAWLVHETRDGDVVLIKGSRGVKLERALEIWKTQMAGALTPHH
jgi:UDP-N-acetylmuramoyl-tripeptide--D-alanyl-D-alanine ligase